MGDHSRMPARERVVWIAVVVGLCIDGGVALISLLFQGALEPLFDIPLKDPAMTTIAGGEYVVVALVYALFLRDPRRYHPLLWLLALDQGLAASLPLLEMLRGHVVATYKTIGPIPISLILAAIYCWGAATRDAATPEAARARVSGRRRE
jgi:hypothetical protein